MRWFRFTFIALALIVSFALMSGCGSSGTPSEPAQAEQQKEVTQGSDKGTVNEPQPEQTKVKLTMGSWRTEDRAAYEKIIAEFNKQYPNIQIEFNPTKNTEYNTVLSTALQTGGGPDIIQLRPYAAGRQLADAGYLEPLDGLPGLEQFSKEALLSASGADGKVYGVPTINSTTLVFYNKKIFEQFNLQEPKTWDEFLNVAETLKQNKVTPFAFGSKEGWILSLTHGALGPAFYSGNDFAQKIVSGATDFKSKEFLASLQMMKDLEPYFPDNYTGIGMDDMRNLFVTEQAGMMVMGVWEVAVMKEMNPDLEMDVFAIPDSSGKQTVTTWVDGSYAVNAKSPHKEEAKKFMEFMTTKTFGAMVADELLKLSALPGVEAKDPLVTKVSQLTYSDMATPYLAVVYFAGGNPSTKSALESSLQGMYLGKLTPQQVAEEVQKSADTWFKPGN
ncbi:MULTISPECIES: ABC transporter substrate-binding protein [unclassified Paenibacillus]|uniref:ABC transporter substrate-binding protein n=1 Tax=unclassified Paenibacillus TaxID=185978 RepID=UPI001C10B4F7|nr:MULTISPECIES: extracellular solute-binding protein [unclassified Paenibacillus]MBU5443845.1 extracellular solute-binding protein [Paenibacillus sp. MSJ-34]CAH0121481.1 Multiple sugar-binding protein [Paenibacillus sp. CECT 9249]